MGGIRIAPLVPLPFIISLRFDMGSKKSNCGAKVVSNGRSPWKFRGAYFYAQNANFKSLFNFVEFVNHKSDDGL